MEITVQPALEPVGVWDPQAAFGFSPLPRHQEWDSEVWSLFLKLSPLQDSPSAFRIAGEAEYKRPAAAGAETSYRGDRKSVKDSLVKDGERFFNFPETSSHLPVKEPQSLVLLPPK